MCARMAHDLRPLPLRLPADIAVGRAASVFQVFRRPVMPLFRLYVVLRLTLCRIAAAALFLRSLSCTLALAGFRRYPVHEM